MLQSRVISEASSTFVSIREFMVVSRACFQIQGFIFRLRLYFKWAIPFSGFATTVSRANRIRSRCATTWLTTSPSGSYSAAPLPSSPETGLTSHCESDKLSLLSLVRMTLTRNNHCERGFRRIGGSNLGRIGGSNLGRIGGSNLGRIGGSNLRRIGVLILGGLGF